MFFQLFQGSASECNFVSLLAARFEVLKELRQRFPFVEEGLLLSKLVAYCSKEVTILKCLLKLNLMTGV